MNIRFEDFGSRLKLKLKENRISQKDLANITGISKTSINNYAQGRIPDAKILYKIAICLGTTMEWLLTGKDVDNEKNINSSYIELKDIHKKLLTQFNRLRKEDQIIALGQITVFAELSNPKKTSLNDKKVKCKKHNFKLNKILIMFFVFYGMILYQLHTYI